MTTTIVPTDVEHTSAAHLAGPVRSTHTADHLTVVWSTREHTCCGDAARHLDDDTPPHVWDRSGQGDWSVDAATQCGTCGTRFGPWAELPTGHLTGDALAEAAADVAWADLRPGHLTGGSDPVGLVEVAERLGKARATVDSWRARGDLPAPRWTVGGRPAWDWAADIVPWARATGRLPEGGDSA